MKRAEQKQAFIRYYKQFTGKTDVNMKEVAKLAQKMGWTLPKPADPLDLLAQQFADAARQEVRRDKKTGSPYRVYHAVRVTQGDQQLSFWIDIDEAPRKKMVKSVVMRREQMVGDGLQLTFDVEHWNRVNPTEEAIPVLLDLTDDVEWRRNAPNEKKKAS